MKKEELYSGMKEMVELCSGLKEMRELCSEQPRVVAVR